MLQAFSDSGLRLYHSVNTSLFFIRKNYKPIGITFGISYFLSFFCSCLAVQIAKGKAKAARIAPKM